MTGPRRRYTDPMFDRVSSRLESLEADLSTIKTGQQKHDELLKSVDSKLTLHMHQVAPLVERVDELAKVGAAISDLAATKRFALWVGKHAAWLVPVVAAVLYFRTGSWDDAVRLARSLLGLLP